MMMELYQQAFAPTRQPVGPSARRPVGPSARRCEARSTAAIQKPHKLGSVLETPGVQRRKCGSQ